jgi:hypothetical protein
VKAWRIGSLVMAAVTLAGCTTGPGKCPGVAEAVPPEAVVSSFNERAGRLTQLWSRLTLRVESREEDGSRRVENLEGHLQFVQPSRVSLLVNKLGETYLVLGCDEARYWWMSLTGERTALVGRHDRASPERAEEFGVPVHPLDLLDLLAVRPIESESARVERDGGRVLVTLPARSEGWGPRLMWLEGAGLTPVRTKVLDASGRTVAEAELRDHGPITVREGFTPPNLARTVWIRIPGRGVEVRMQFHEADNRRPRREVFDVEELTRRFRIAPERVLDLDAPRADFDGVAP